MFWNASNGDHFRQHDAHCPLQSIGCLIGRENVSKVFQLTIEYRNKLTATIKS